MSVQAAWMEVAGKHPAWVVTDAALKAHHAMGTWGRRVLDPTLLSDVRVNAGKEYSAWCGDNSTMEYLMIDELVNRTGAFVVRRWGLAKKAAKNQAFQTVVFAEASDLDVLFSELEKAVLLMFLDETLEVGRAS